MTYIVKRKLRGVLGDNVDSADMANLLQHTQSNPVNPSTFQDELTLNRLRVKHRNGIPVGTDKFNASPITKFESYLAGEDHTANIFGVNWEGQTFTPPIGHIIKSVKLKLFRAGSPGIFTVSIRATDSGLPTGADLASGTTDGNTLPTTAGTAELRKITLGAGTALVSGTQYGICARVASGDAGNRVDIRSDDSTATYAGGTRVASSDSGSSWFTGIPANNDQIFEEWGIILEAGSTWDEGSNLHSIDENSVERTYIHTDDVDDTPVNGATTDPISSNWAFDHLNDDDVHDATQVNVSELSTATHDDVQDYINFFGDRTLLSGGAITDNGDGTIAIASLTAWSAISDSETAVGKFFDFAGGNTPSLTDMTTNYIYLDYNGGTPQLVVSTSILTHGFKLDHIHIGTAFRDGTETHFHKPTNFELDLGAKVDMHHQEETLVHRVDGLITTATGTRNLDVTAGVLYEGLNRHTSLPFDTSRSGTADFNEVNKLHDADGDFSVNDVGKSVHNTTDNTYGTITAFVDSGELTLDGDTFPDGNENYNIDFWTYHYFDGDLGTPAWVEVHGATQISNSQYNDVDTGLANFTANRYGVSWVFMEIDGQHFHVVYGQGDYKVNEAEEAGVPSSLPNIVTNYCALVAKIILRQGQTTMTITYPWTTVFTSSLATDHGSLGGLSDVADHAYALLHNGTRALSGAWNMGSQLITNLKLGGTMDVNSQALINVLDLDLGTESITGTFSATLTAANAGIAWLIKSKDTSDILRPRLSLSGGVDTAVWGWVNSTHTGIVLSGALNANSNAITNHAQAIADNAILTVDHVTPVATDYARFTANGLEGREKSEVLGDLNVADGADVTGNNAPQAHEGSHVSGGSDDIDSALADAAIPNLATSKITSGQFSLDRIPRGTDTHVLTAKGAGVSPAYEAPAGGGAGGLAIFGDGSDGNVTISSNTDLTRDMFYDDLTIDNTYTLSTKGYRIFVKGILTNNGTIERTGNNTSSSLGGAALTAGSLGESAKGGNGRAGGAGVGFPGDSLTSSFGGNGGGGGATTGYNGGSGGTTTAPTAAIGGFKTLPFAVILKEIESTVIKITGGAGGGGGARRAGGGGDGGGGGGGGGVLLIVAKTIINSSGTISANGGDGANGSLPEGGGGGGGGGGVLILIYNSLTTGTETANGGAFGTGQGVAGQDGVAGSNGTVIKVVNA